jgi:hypothetical protein
LPSLLVGAKDPEVIPVTLPSNAFDSVAGRLTLLVIRSLFLPFLQLQRFSLVSETGTVKTIEGVCCKFPATAHTGELTFPTRLKESGVWSQ